MLDQLVMFIGSRNDLVKSGYDECLAHTIMNEPFGTVVDNGQDGKIIVDFDSADGILISQDLVDILDN